MATVQEIQARIDKKQQEIADAKKELRRVKQAEARKAQKERENKYSKFGEAVFKKFGWNIDDMTDEMLKNRLDSLTSDITSNATRI